MDKNSKRKPTRLKNFDYSSSGAYFITICTHNKQNIFWNDCRCRVDPCGQPHVEYTQLGLIAKNTIRYMEEKYGVEIDKYVIMPNHIHLIVIISNSDERLTSRVNPTISQIIGGYKSKISTEYLKHNEYIGEIWQRSFHDHIIRGNADYQKIWKYIDTNVIKWNEDCFYNE